MWCLAKICFENKCNTAIVPCGHTFCNICIESIKSKHYNCPICRTKIESILPIYFGGKKDVKKKNKLTDKTLIELKEFAKKLKLKGYSSLNKDDLIKFIIKNMKK